jgi:hypothetical protein
VRINTTTNVTVTVPAGATTGTVSTNNCGYDWWNGRLGIALELLRLREQSSITMPTVATITPASATEGIWLCLLTAKQPSAVDTSYTFVLTNGAAGALHTTECYRNCWGNYGNRIGTNNCDTIDEVNENFSIALELFRLRVQLSTITMPLLWQRILLRLPKDLMCVSTATLLQ